MSVLGVDWATEMAAEFASDFRDATLTHVVSTARDPLELSGPHVQTTSSHTCKALTFAYKRQFVEDTAVLDGDFLAIMLRSSISPSVAPAAGDSLTCALPGGSVEVTAHVERIIAATEAFYTLHRRGAGL